MAQVEQRTIGGAGQGWGNRSLSRRGALERFLTSFVDIFYGEFCAQGIAGPERLTDVFEANDPSAPTWVATAVT